ncbi:MULTISPECIES: AAA family ATPase [Amycolatopsis]|uniref:Cobaltochelatase CobS n=1 Tax=Amycolatopsis saalfeldensis TaxID=394193 RepID=A0A1H8YPD9_9PSEU|nr:MULTISPECIES: AAA family ATPase [Amycolatopsis]SEP54057.1 cobaltochelatase CobS [Amycolatopsis saalfeldensis]
MLVKHSRRTIRSGCKKCGNRSLYWAHDTEQGGDHCEDCDTSGKWVLIGAAGTLHKCAGDDVTTSGAVEEKAPNKLSAVPANEHEEKAVSTPVPTLSAPAGDAFAAFQSLVASLAPKVDRDEVAAMIKSEMDNIIVPTRTVVERASGERRIIPNSHEKLADVTTDLLAGEHVLMVGPAGTGKSTIAEQAAESIGIPYYSISLSPMTAASQIIGYMQAEGEYVRSLFREAFEHGGVFHFDEFDNGHPSVLAVINASLANGHMAFPDQMVKRHPDFRCVASANTYGRGPDRAYVGRQQVDAATLDRFSIETIGVDEALEQSLCLATGIDKQKALEVLDYVRRLRKNAEESAMTVVISPRASVGMCRLLAAGKTWDAAVESRVHRGMGEKDWNKLRAAC